MESITYHEQLLRLRLKRDVYKSNIRPAFLSGSDVCFLRENLMAISRRIEIHGESNF